MKNTMEDDKTPCIWGKPREETDFATAMSNKFPREFAYRIQSVLGNERNRQKTYWGLKDRPTIDNVHPDDEIELCDNCGEDKEECDCYCGDCGKLRDDCSYCSECDSDECSCSF